MNGTSFFYSLILIRSSLHFFTEIGSPKCSHFVSRGVDRKTETSRWKKRKGMCRPRIGKELCPFCRIIDVFWYFHERFSILDDTIYRIHFCGFLIYVFVFWIIVWILPKRLKTNAKVSDFESICLICNRSYRGREVLPRNHPGGEGSCYRLRNLRRNNNKNKIKLR